MTVQELAYWEYIVSIALVFTMKIVCFILAYLTVRLGHGLIRAGASGDFKFSARIGGAKADLVSVSPGLLFVLLGVLLAGFAIYVPKPVKQDFTVSTVQGHDDLSDAVRHMTTPGVEDAPDFSRKERKP